MTPTCPGPFSVHTPPPPNEGGCFLPQCARQATTFSNQTTFFFFFFFFFFTIASTARLLLTQVAARPSIEKTRTSLCNRPVRERQCAIHRPETWRPPSTRRARRRWQSSPRARPGQLLQATRTTAATTTTTITILLEPSSRSPRAWDAVPDVLPASLWSRPHHGPPPHWLLLLLLLLLGLLGCFSLQPLRWKRFLLLLFFCFLSLLSSVGIRSTLDSASCQGVASDVRGLN
ncbi:hypothetical protein BD289DRAFT_153191 [Coniella lustricola]|uniref:Uncharacterized protein n=1 Tax=Coniella lustricola TaxID=2025994 RepID=A0A2T2ZUL4_9PEZI|nr:hypothetical protein BD289DRAFT_153191 [Coniella lustricola]